MSSYYGDFAEDDTVNILFNTFDSNDPSASVTITNLADSDIHVHKDGSVTQIVTDGATVVINFDGITGNHMITIDTSAHADYSTGSEYAVRIEGTTVDGAQINAWVGSFSIERAGGVLALLKGTNSLSDIEGKIDTLQTDLDNATDGLGALKTLIDAVKTETALIVSDTNELQQDDIPGTLSTIQTSTDRLTAVRAAVLTDWINGGRLDALLDLVALEATVAGLNDLSAANVNAEVVDALKTDTVTLPGQTAPPLTPTFEEMISWLYKVLRNRKRQTATAWELMDDAETTVDAKATVSDDGTTAIKQEIVTGP